MDNERIIKNYPSQATGILYAPAWKNRKWLAISSQIPTNSIVGVGACHELRLAISSQIPTNSIIKEIDIHFVRRPLVL